MQIAGHKVWPVAVAALAIYLLGFIWYGFLFAEPWQKASGYPQEALDANMWKMALGPIMPILLAIGLSIVCQWRNVVGWQAGALTGLVVSVFFVLSTRLYGYVYSPETLTKLLIDVPHYLLIGVIGGAILGRWR